MNRMRMRIVRRSWMKFWKLLLGDESPGLVCCAFPSSADNLNWGWINRIWWVNGSTEIPSARCFCCQWSEDGVICSIEVWVAEIHSKRPLASSPIPNCSLGQTPSNFKILPNVLSVVLRNGLSHLNLNGLQINRLSILHRSCQITAQYLMSDRL